jgi:hypothetical protein
MRLRRFSQPAPTAFITAWQVLELYCVAGVYYLLLTTL